MKVNTAEQAQNDVGILRDALYTVVEKNAAGLEPDQVVRILKSMSEDMYAVGIDNALRNAESRIKIWDNIASAWDLTWLTLFAYRLARAKRNKRS